MPTIIMDPVTESSSAQTTPKATLSERLNQIRSNPGLQSQQQNGVVLSAVEDTLKSQKSEFTPTAYFAALLSLLNQYVSTGITNKEVANAVVYLLDLVTPNVPRSLLRSKFSQILTTLAPAISHEDADAQFLRSATGCLVSLLIVQDAQAWALPQSQIGPRQATAGLLALSSDSRPKVRKCAQDGLYRVLTNPPPSPSADHPAADMCAETALRTFETLTTLVGATKKQRSEAEAQNHAPALIHIMQLVKTIASASGGWPSRSTESLCEVLFSVAKSRSEFLTVSAFEVFEAVFEGIAKQKTFSKLPRLIEAVSELEPSQNDTQLLPPWLAVVSRAFDVSSQFDPDDTFVKLPPLFSKIAGFMASPSHNIRISASECLISLLVNCVSANVILEPSVYDEKILEMLASTVADLLSVKYQASWMEVFNVVGAAFDNLKWRSETLLRSPLSVVGTLRGEDSFAGKTQVDEVISKAIAAMGPEAVLNVLPLNLNSSKAGKQGRAWLIPLIRDAVSNTNLAHFKRELVPLSEKLFERVAQHKGQQTMETKILETLISQIWATLPGYCDQTLDLVASFDQGFAELLCNVLYQQPEMRLNVCRALQTLVDSNKLIAEMDGDEDLILQGRITKVQAQKNIAHLTSFSANLLAVLFNVYGETSTQQRGNVLECIDSYLSVTGAAELALTFTKVTTMLETTIRESSGDEKAKKKQLKPGEKPPMSHALMDIVVTSAIYLPRESFQSLFGIASIIISQQKEAQLQKKAYKLIPRLSQSEIGRTALQERSIEIRQMLIENSERVTVPARKDRLNALAHIVETLSPEDLSFIPAVLPEVILATKETAERARASAFDLLILMGEKMRAGGVIRMGTVSTNATLDEFLTMLSAGLAGNSPHMISASVTALSRVLYDFHDSISESSTLDLLQTMDLFLQSPAREIVRAVLGFVKVSIMVLATEVMGPRLPNIVPALMRWSHEQKAHFRVKVKSILERMIRRFGVDVVDKYCPQEDKKLISNIRKVQQRRKRKQKAGEEGEEDDDANLTAPRKMGKYENGFDQAIYGSDDDDSDAASGDEDAVPLRNPKSKKGKSETYIHEDEEEPLDLLDRKSLANISSTKPSGKQAPPTKRKAKVDLDGKLDLRNIDEDDDEMPDVDEGDGSLEKGINAYVEAIRGRDSARRGPKGKLKFSNKRDGEGDEMDEDEEEVVRVPTPTTRPAGRGERGGFSDRGSRSGRGGSGVRGCNSRSGRGEIRPGRSDFKSQRRGLGVDKRRGGGITKSKGRGGVTRQRW